MAGLDLRDLVPNRRTIDVDLFGHHESVTYAPQRMTVAWQLGIGRGRPAHEVLAEIVLEWTLTLDGEPLPVDPATMAADGFAPIWERIWELIWRDFSTGKAMSPPSEIEQPDSAKTAKK